MRMGVATAHSRALGMYLQHPMAENEGAVPADEEARRQGTSLSTVTTTAHSTENLRGPQT